MSGYVVAPLAHAGHWLASLVYVVPPLAVVIWIAVVELRDRRRKRGEGAGRHVEGSDE